IGRDIDRAIRTFSDITNSKAQAFKQAFLAGDAVALDRQAHQRGGRQAADKDVALPIRKRVALIEDHARWCDHRRPGVDRINHAFLLLDAFADGGAIIIYTKRHNRPSVIGARLDNIQLIAALGPMFNLPKNAGLGIDRGSLNVAVAVGPDLRKRAILIDKRIVVGNRTVGIDADDFAEMRVEFLRLATELLVRALAQCDKKIAIRVEYEARTKMELAVSLRLLAEDDFDLLEGGIVVAQLAASNSRAVTTFACLCEAQINEAIFFEVGIQCDIQQSALSAGINLRYT